ncbi:MAG: ATP-binding protein [Thermomicrobiales bacterium]
MPFLPASAASIDDLLRRKEGQLFDRKSMQISPRDFAPHLVAFANADGGEIALGIASNGEVEGVRGREDRANELTQASINFCTPPVRVSSRSIPCINRKGEEDFVMLIAIEQSERVHTTTNGDTYLRIGDESRRLSYEQQRQLMYDKGEQRYEDELIADVPGETFDEQLLARFRERIGMEGDTERTLIARYLARRDKDARTKVTRAGILLFHTTPALHFPTGDIRFIRYAGTTIATGVRQNITADKRYEGPLPRIVEAVFHDIGAILRQFTRLNPTTSTFETEPEYPLFAWQEAIVNAVTHRAYSISGQRIEIRLFDNRMEIESPGRLPGLVHVENMRDVHFLRNPRIARVMNDFGFVQELGEGVDRMYREMELLGLPEPRFREKEGSVLVTLENAMANRGTAKSIVELVRDLPREQRELLIAIAQQGFLSPKDAERVIGRSRPTVIKYLKGLMQMGLVARRAAAGNDPHAVYIIVSSSIIEELRSLVT